MGRDSFGVLTGLAVLVTGLVAVVMLIGPTGDAVVEPPPSVSLAEPEPVAATTADLPGVGPSVTRVLLWGGGAEMADGGDLAQLPPSVAAVLIEYGLPLRVPDPPETAAK
jgi:hypothetical protein